jgi:hypothetical protein
VHPTISAVSLVKYNGAQKYPPVGIKSNPKSKTQSPEHSVSDLPIQASNALAGVVEST